MFREDSFHFGARRELAARDFGIGRGKIGFFLLGGLVDRLVVSREAQKPAGDASPAGHMWIARPSTASAASLIASDSVGWA